MHKFIDKHEVSTEGEVVPQKLSSPTLTYHYPYPTHCL